jgi:methionine aminopeptidase
MNIKKCLFIVFLFITQVAVCQSTIPVILPLKERARVQDEWLQERIKKILPDLMRREGIDMWIIIAREYNEDPVIKTMLPSTWVSARRRTILVAFDNGKDKEIETLAVARYDIGESFKKAWDPEKQPDQWKRLSEIIEERNPKKIGINKSEHFALADGISASEHEFFLKALSKRQKDKVVSAEKLAVAWLETRSTSEMVVYEQICRIAHEIIKEAFSEKVIQPGITTTDDVVWFMRERVKELKLDTWFHPTVAVQRADPESFDHLRTFSKRPDREVIMPGDLLHTDFGITYLGLNTDTQQHAYVLKPEEKDAPEYLKNAFRQGNRLQDILTSEFITGKTGNQILAAALQKAKAENNKGTIYTHPIGFHGHAAGPTIGMWDNQGPTPHTGDYPLYKNTAYSIELNSAVFIKEWNKEIRIMLEEEAFFDEVGIRYIDGRQEDLILIPRVK